MKKKLKHFGRKGKEVALVPSSKGDKMYSIFQEESGKLTCECIGYAVRKKCRHIKEYLERSKR